MLELQYIFLSNILSLIDEILTNIKRPTLWVDKPNYSTRNVRTITA